MSSEFQEETLKSERHLEPQECIVCNCLTFFLRESEKTLTFHFHTCNVTSRTGAWESEVVMTQQEQERQLQVKQWADQEWRCLSALQCTPRCCRAFLQYPGAGGLSISFFFLLGKRIWLSPCSVALRYIIPPCAHPTTAMCGVGN